MSAPTPRFWTLSSIARIVGSAVFVAGLAVAGISGGCSSLSSERPPIPDSTLSTLLKEIHLSVARHNSDALQPRGLRDSVLARHGVSTAQFDATLEYYSRHPAELKSLYGPIIDSLKALRYGGETPRPDQPPDSIRERTRRQPSNE